MRLRPGNLLRKNGKKIRQPFFWLCVIRTLRRAGDESLQSRRDAAGVELGLMTKEETDELVDPLLMAEPEKMAPIVAAFKEKLGILI